ncbi:hydroxymethylpyrimidine/phosphomethylpyrimidine kinase [Reichenbachiella carrageenanivorans]|uniref:hydroxymethylpyrimidine kinase n=1 Tax=Reichenbachiella carrageenanivorans TaxID=2979869 RepID=A0ABY6D009_9BACT|nr:hydroxymethylpyrimidine/phosphomethylpyrimidine kinase [Reichenbachiella carrageenanivorans]UXX78403.1 hydroxymethylpyrimidine/phosphomethylpyrimidine kinase [Reichenbachiella carrageenanivorans]
MPDNEQNIVLSVAGFDPCGGAGVLADMQTLQQCKVQGMAAITALTAQHEDKVNQINWQDFESIKAQLDTLFEKYEFHIVKIGIVQDLNTLDQLLDLLLAHKAGIKIIWDPILQSSSGFDFLKELKVAQLTKVLSKLFLITPNLPEYEQLQKALNGQPITTNILLKGGHTEGNDTSDRLIHIDGTESQISGYRVKGKNKHGTGCVLSSAIAAGLSKGMKLKTACTFGKRYVEGYLKSGINKLGKHYEIEI